MTKNSVIKEQMNNIKLVIWDLDDTFWKGTLSEEGITLNDDNINIVKELINRGIMNSICSKNDFGKVKTELEKNDLWKCFIFPKISWSPKGEMVVQIIKDAQLRAENILFIDDNHMNLEEVKFYNPKINVMHIDEISDILSFQAFKGKDDKSHSRLKQYKILEVKTIESTKYSSNIEFLMDSNIKVEIIKDFTANIDRIYELIHRTNQLNFTKQRISKAELEELINDSDIQKGLVKVSDNYGEYGICGFYAIKENKLVHFLFSCRAMNLGVEQWVYSKLGFPKIEISGEVASELEDSGTPKWINQKNFSNIITPENNVINGNVKCLIRGGCDLKQLNHYLKYKNVDITTEFNYMNNEGFSIHRDHSEILRSAYILSEKDKEYLIQNIPFFDANIFDTSIFELKYDVIVYSVLMDYTHAVYSSKSDKNLVVTYGDFKLPLTDESCWDFIIENYGGKFNLEFLKWFKNNFDFDGPLSEQRFEENLKWLRKNIPAVTKLIILNGSEVNLPHKLEKDRYLHHIKMNSILQRFVESTEGVYIVDVNKHIKTISDVTDNIRHYKREYYSKIAMDINEIIQKELSTYNIIDKKELLKLKTIDNLKIIVRKITSKNTRKFINKIIRPR
ncbi:HAD-IIIC family phosphatase [Clostridium estertheticum]|uniref:HAD-IIIC family phosphatase n=1 Tax=Clostridium estertheticum TaxID=238834 RepID=A0A7Y3SYW2_9CLOT|nr:HAD-IIIC family phosphatase [Clostridium estertheticum]MBW9171003.1 HAD-IIIC family phosphatase [Clostridium estertheticum]NNU77915.1 HAD-IIIC family phosphatase [Clostridium estertheticum]WBL46041.1 HAD-IIIC family phosphatase [Clostridium estertheticum]WLC74130.1 HAD-IIIC family phosphatase [Clostridium estertheticum]